MYFVSSCCTQQRARHSLSASVLVLCLVRYNRHNVSRFMRGYQRQHTSRSCLTPPLLLLHCHLRHHPNHHQHSGANLSTTCIPRQGVHNGCWYAAPQDVDRTSVDRFEASDIDDAPSSILVNSRPLMGCTDPPNPKGGRCPPSVLSLSLSSL